jgi:hypothetical protein
MRSLDVLGVIPVCEPADHQAGIEFDSFKLTAAAGADIVLIFGAVTGDAVLSLYVGATVGAKTTKIPFRYRLSSGDFKAASADLYAAEATDADGDLTLTAATYDHRVLVIHLDAQELIEAKPWVTVDVDATASVLLLSAVAILHQPRNQPALTNLA